jgi:hypothetical protein
MTPEQRVKKRREIVRAANKRYVERNRELVNEKAKERARQKKLKGSAKHATTCAECGKAIVSKYPRKYCSNNCRNAWWNHKRPYQSSLFATADRPDSAPVCSVPGCGRHLYGYEVEWGKCLPHKHGGIIQHRETVPTHQPAARAGAGD